MYFDHHSKNGWILRTAPLLSADPSANIRHADLLAQILQQLPEADSVRGTPIYQPKINRAICRNLPSAKLAPYPTHHNHHLICTKLPQTSSHLVVPSPYHFQLCTIIMAPLKVGDTFPAATFTYIPYTPETSDVVACGTPQPFDAQKVSQLFNITGS